MARPLKQGLDYFSFDVDFFEDDKIVAVFTQFGIKGEITAIKLLCAIYRNGYFAVWDEKLRIKLLRNLPGVSMELLTQIVNSLLKWGFFNKELFESDGILTSHGIQARYFAGTKRRISAKTKLPYLLVSAYNNSVSVCNNSVSVCNNSQSKVNKNVSPSVETSPARKGPGENSVYLKEFFSDTNQIKLDVLMAHLGLQPGDRQTLENLATEVVNEWALSEKQHYNYTDFAMHLISSLRIKCAQANSAARSSNTRNHNKKNVNELWQ